MKVQYPYCTNLVCLCRKQSASGHPGAKLSFTEAVCAVWRPLYNQRRPPRMLRGTVHINAEALL